MVKTAPVKTAPAPERADCRQFGVRTLMAGKKTLVQLRGELDILTGPPTTEYLEELMAGREPELVLDLRELSFIDCTGLSVLCGMRRSMAERGGRLALVIGHPCVPRLLRLLRLTDAFELHETVTSALASGRYQGDRRHNIRGG